MQNGIEELIEKRMKRALGAILGMKDREVDPFLPPAVAARMRAKILQEMNDFVDVLVDIIESVDDGTVSLNEHWLNLIGEIHAHVVTAPAAPEPAEV